MPCHRGHQDTALNVPVAVWEFAALVSGCDSGRVACSCSFRDDCLRDCAHRVAKRFDRHIELGFKLFFRRDKLPGNFIRIEQGQHPVRDTVRTDFDKPLGRHSLGTLQVVGLHQTIDKQVCRRRQTVLLQYRIGEIEKTFITIVKGEYNRLWWQFFAVRQIIGQLAGIDYIEIILGQIGHLTLEIFKRNDQGAGSGLVFRKAMVHEHWHRPMRQNERERGGNNHGSRSGHYYRRYLQTTLGLFLHGVSE